jgi:hypothetical protein
MILPGTWVLLLTLVSAAKVPLWAFRPIQVPPASRSACHAFYRAPGWQSKQPAPPVVCPAIPGRRQGAHLFRGTRGPPFPRYRGKGGPLEPAPPACSCHARVKGMKTLRLPLVPPLPGISPGHSLIVEPLTLGLLAVLSPASWSNAAIT